jgi:hypothetical protein
MAEGGIQGTACSERFGGNYELYKSGKCLHCVNLESQLREALLEIGSLQFINKLLYKELRNETTRNEPVTNNAAEDGVCEDLTGTIAWSQVASTYKRNSKNLRCTDILQPRKSLPTTNRFSTLTELPEPLTSSEANFVTGKRTIYTSDNKCKRKEEQRSTRHIPNNHYVRNYGQPSKVY